jgi:subtilisin family serine protease
VRSERADQILAARGLTRTRRIKNLNTDVLRLPPGLSVEQAVSIFSRLPEVAFAEPNYIAQALAPAREEVVDQWGLLKIQAPEAWAEIEPKIPVLIAIVDSGIQRDHLDLADNIWSNPGEIPSNGVDDDGNGYVDDTWGWDFQNGDNEPYDDYMHGTAVASVAAGVQDATGYGVAGVCPWCQIMSVKSLSSRGSGTYDTVAAGIVYAADNGARVINLSLGGPATSQSLQDAVNYAWDAGALVVAAAGNDGAEMLFYPAAYVNAMAIASSNEDDYHSCFSNYSDGFISVAAPGEHILSAELGADHNSYSGTSLASPHAAGLGALLFSHAPALTNAQVRDRIEATAEDLGPEGTDAFFGTGRINALRAVSNDTSPTIPPTGFFSDDLTASGFDNTRKLARDINGKLHLTWHAGDGSLHQVMYATSIDDGVTWTKDVVFESSAKSFHPALAIDDSNVYIAFPTQNAASIYEIHFTRKPLDGGDWSAPAVVMGGSYNAVRPDMYVDPINNRLHLVASSLEDAPYVYYASSADQGANWSTVKQINVTSGGSPVSRHADVHANGSQVTIAGRTAEPILYGLATEFKTFTFRSVDGGNSWSDLNTELGTHSGMSATESGLALAGVGDQLYLIYELA